MLARSLATLLLLALPAVAAADTLGGIKERGTIRLGVRADAIPFSFTDTLGERGGYTVQLCRAVSADLKKELGLAELKVEYVEVTTEDRFAALNDGRIDILCGATSVTLSRLDEVDFSSATFVTGMGVLYRNDGPTSFAELAGKKIGVRGGTTTEETLKRELDQAGLTVEIVSIDDHEAALEELAEGKIDAYFADRAILIYLLQASGKADVLTVGERLYTIESYALALPLDDRDFRIAVDRALSRIYRSPMLDQIYTASFGDQQPGDILRALYVLGAIPD
ncbi:MAG: amino acid ABC transporter substrate-binding protein [Geminicoccaceae bacterium]|jgi:polar amino acid transport system substrate-binding protein/glutamate/aspartate transport system substrate-binding protein|nr:amino acid ABC transporter substrate-binding protein [Geminicoccaceae bacterium]MCB9966116.1 amino acid ABC transporter substrate-binding protein [Geminicoccaceae bacterium]HRY23703.1 amino acid ABC transporter substrate-binding protein [Geminicoccaceae bacterium]